MPWFHNCKTQKEPKKKCKPCWPTCEEANGLLVYLVFLFLGKKSSTAAGILPTFLLHYYINKKVLHFQNHFRILLSGSLWVLDCKPFLHQLEAPLDL